MWETHGLMTRINKANFTTICNRKLCSTIPLIEDRLDMALAPRFFNGGVAQMVDTSLCMREVRGSMPRISNFAEEPGNRDRKYGKLFCQTKRRLGLVRPICKKKHLKQYRACWKSYWCPESPRFTSERRQRKHCSTDKWIKDIPLTKTARLGPTSEAWQQKGQAIGMWETLGLMTRIDKGNFTTICNRKLCSTIALTEDRFDIALAPRFFNGEVAQMVERSLRIREVRGSVPRISTFSEEPGNRKGKYGKLFC